MRDYEPAAALYAGEDGLAIYRRLIPQAFAHLEPGGTLLLEIGHGQREALHHLLAQSGFDGHPLHRRPAANPARRHRPKVPKSLRPKNIRSMPLA